MKILKCLFVYSFFLSNICHNLEVWISRMQKCFCLYRSKLITQIHVIHSLLIKFYIPLVSDLYLCGLCRSSIWLEILKLFNNPIRVLTQNQYTGLWFVFLLKLSKWALDICLKKEKKRRAVYMVSVRGRWRQGINNQYYTLTPFCSKR